ncbi:MAG: hypothetical protein GXO75_03045 [Calditrichaeota bacterium]|nr:hypothetical protein [Calditrichota bacterium]
MKIESQVYTRYLTETPSVENRRGKSKGIQPQKSNAVQKSVQKSQIRATHEAGAKQAVTTLHKAENSSMPSALSDVISAEERAMLRQIFPENGAKWGAAAYKSADFSLNDLSIGKKLDLMS